MKTFSNTFAGVPITTSLAMQLELSNRNASATAGGGGGAGGASGALQATKSWFTGWGAKATTAPAAVAASNVTSTATHLPTWAEDITSDVNTGGVVLSPATTAEQRQQQ